jgi:hypothetical protein
MKMSAEVFRRYRLLNPATAFTADFFYCFLGQAPCGFETNKSFTKNSRALTAANVELKSQFNSNTEAKSYFGCRGATPDQRLASLIVNVPAVRPAD